MRILKVLLFDGTSVTYHLELEHFSLNSNNDRRDVSPYAIFDKINELDCRVSLVLHNGAIIQNAIGFKITDPQCMISYWFENVNN